MFLQPEGCAPARCWARGDCQRWGLAHGHRENLKDERDERDTRRRNGDRMWMVVGERIREGWRWQQGSEEWGPARIVFQRRGQERFGLGTAAPLKNESIWTLTPGGGRL